jgi:hypothetical protein
MLDAAPSANNAYKVREYTTFVIGRYAANYLSTAYLFLSK